MNEQPTALPFVETPSPAPAKRRRKAKAENLTCRNGWYYFRKQVNGKRKLLSLDTQDPELARARLRAKLGELRNGELEKMRGKQTKGAKVADLLETYAKGIARVVDRIEASTVTSNVQSFRSFLRWAHARQDAGTWRRNEELAVDELALADALTPATVGEFKHNYVAAAGDDRQAREARRRGAASILRQAASLVAERAMNLYGDLALPDVAAFKRAAKMEVEARAHRPIDNATLRAMHNEMIALRTGSPAEQQLWLVHFLHKVAGLRNEEIAAARVEWFSRAPWGQVFLSIITRPYFEPKGSEGHVPLSTEAAALLVPFVTGKQPADHLVQAATKTDREELIYRTHARWIRRHLPAGQFAKAGYELRRWAAQVMEAKYGNDAAAAFLRHAPKTVAERHYFERWFPWRRCGENVGITLADLRGLDEGKTANVWLNGADALGGLQTPEVRVAVGQGCSR